MSLGRVHAVLAAGVEHPRLLERWRDDPARLRALGVAPESLDLEALGKFAGLSVKVRHNPLRAHLPLSFRLMSAAAIEIAVFSAYAAFRSRQGLGYAPTVPARARDLIDFLRGWLDPRDRVHALLWDAIRYEEGLARLGPWYAPTAQAPPAFGGDAPRIRGDILVLELRCDPRILAQALHASAPDFARVPLAPRCACIWRAPEADGAAVLALDEFGGFLLAQIDGTRTPAALARRLGGGRGTTRAVREALHALAGLGVVDSASLEPRHSGRAARACA